MTRHATGEADDSSDTVTVTVSAPSAAVVVAWSCLMLIKAAWTVEALAPLGMSRDVYPAKYNRKYLHTSNSFTVAIDNCG